MILEVLAGFLSGIISGMGIGGGTILIPTLTMFLNVSQHTAQGANLLFFIPTAIVAIFVHKKNGNLQFKTAFPLIVWGVIGALCGSFLAIRLEQKILKKMFGVFLFLMGSYEIFKGFKNK